ncbi:hypothetical protein HPB51_012842 [Rhipicephalus microplus]|uniref:histone deacetylase n=1 Tax=Rhipicephalus microplus TaxID=6941 RepID=A0A9J6E9X0_RHIMP|nr:hypothetical protein HPB51_012842 [Rhipicephalus microplus]
MHRTESRRDDLYEMCRSSEEKTPAYIDETERCPASRDPQNRSRCKTNQRPHKATQEEMTKYHSDDYIRFLRSIRPDNMSEYNKQMQRFNVGEDCPVFDGLYEFCQLSTGGSVAGAVKLNKQATDIAVNWAGGLHHAKNSSICGKRPCCGPLKPLRESLLYHQRVLYIDVDIHHGDGVEEAFYTTDRVMTCSFHKYGEYFPGTGDLRDIGAGKGKYYAVNFPLRDGIDDESYESIFQPLISKVMEMYQPSAVVLQCGADSLSGDRLGCFNLTLKGHGKCAEFVRRYNLPLLQLGGGGYTIRNVARCWTYETAVALGVDIANELPYNDYFEYFGPDFKLHISPSNMANQNTPEYLEKIRTRLFENLRMLPHAPGVQMQRRLRGLSGLMLPNGTTAAVICGSASSTPTWESGWDMCCDDLITADDDADTAKPCMDWGILNEVRGESDLEESDCENDEAL